MDTGWIYPNRNKDAMQVFIKGSNPLVSTGNSRECCHVHNWHGRNNPLKRPVDALNRCRAETTSARVGKDTTQ
jgi:hypothetical protein